MIFELFWTSHERWGLIRTQSFPQLSGDIRGLLASPERKPQSCRKSGRLQSQEWVQICTSKTLGRASHHGPTPMCWRCQHQPRERLGRVHGILPVKALSKVPGIQTPDIPFGAIFLFLSPAEVGRQLPLILPSFLWASSMSILTQWLLTGLFWYQKVFDASMSKWPCQIFFFLSILLPVNVHPGLLDISTHLPPQLCYHRCSPVFSIFLSLFQFHFLHLFFFVFYQ